MKIFSLLWIFLILICFTACKEPKIEEFKKVQSIDLSNLGNLNAIHLIDSSLYLLDASYSTLYRLDKDNKAVKILKVPITHRAFLLDFAVKGDKFYFVNTYDEIFVTNVQGMIADTIKVTSPDKILIADDKIYITERIPTGNNLKLIAVSDSTTEILAPEVENYNPQRVGDCFLNYQKKLYLISADQQTLFSRESDNLFTSYKILADNEKLQFRPGRFYINDNSGLLLGTINNKNYIILFDIENNIIKPTLTQEIPQELDLSISEISEDKIYIYNYIDKQILIYNWPEN